jgi:hypothetical protein
LGSDMLPQGCQRSLLATAHPYLFQVYRFFQLGPIGVSQMIAD